MSSSEMELSNWISEFVKEALAEDIGSGDVTTDSIVSKNQEAKAIWIAKEEGVVAGLDIAKKVFQELDDQISWNPNFSDGEKVSEGQTIVEISGNCRAILTAERTSLNIVQRMSGIATATRRVVEILAEFETNLLDTRKTAPGLRLLDKLAVKAGGGINHRMGLYDLAMIKENHIVAAGGITKAVQYVRVQRPEIKIEVETTTLDEVQEALCAGADIIMLDNMTIDEISEAVNSINGSAQTEASGGITIENVREIAKTGINYISMGFLTHSVRAFDISQRLIHAAGKSI
jgi:nicotinate-nucleotide pyrophosphorylase (carboxylating)